MPVVEVPDLGAVEFPDSMSNEDIESVLSKRKKPFITPATPPIDALERAARNFQQAGMATAPVDYTKRPIEAGGDIITPAEGFGFPTVKTPPEAGALEKTGAGLYNLGAGAANFALSLPGIATMAAPELLGAKFAAPIIKGTLLGLTAKQAGQKLGEASVTGDIQDYVEGGGAALGGALLGANAIPEAFPERIGPLQGPIAQGSLLQGPTGAVPFREGAELPSYIVSPEQAELAAKAMSKEATVAYEPARPSKPTVPETPPEPERNVTMAAESKAERDAMIDRVRKTGARTKEAIKQLFPEMNRQQAAQLRNEAWEGISEETPPSSTVGGTPATEAASVTAVEGAELPVPSPQTKAEPTITTPNPQGSIVTTPVTKGRATTADILGKVVDSLESEAVKARQRLSKVGTTFGSGPLHEIPNIRDYAIIGAAKLARFGLEKGKWATEMVRDLGERIRPHLDRIYSEATDLFNRHTQRITARETPIQEIIGAATGAPGKPSSTGEVIDTLRSSLNTVRTLRDHFEGAPNVSRAAVKQADDWLEADASKIKESLTQLAKEQLPVFERGRFITAINNATKRSPILTGDPQAMYRRAAEVAARIEDRANEVQKTATINEIKDSIEKSLKSPSVDIGYKAKIVDAIKRISLTKPTQSTLDALRSTRGYIERMQSEGKDVDLPNEVLDSLEVLSKQPAKEMPLNVLEAIRDRVQMLDQLGRLKVKSRAQVWEIEKAAKTSELVNELTNPLEARPQFQPQPGENRTMTMKVRNWMNRQLNMNTVFDKAILPIDALFELLGDAKGTYKGWLFKNVRNPLDLDYNAAQIMRDRLIAPVERLIKENNMGEKESQRIGVYAEAQQDGGVERMVAQGVKPETIEKILGSITPQELSVYRAMRTAMDSTLPEVQKLMHDLYNIDVKPVENYFPMQRAWDLYELEPQGLKQPQFGSQMEFDDLAGWKQMLGDYLSPKTTKASRGFTIERQPGAETPIKLNAFDVFHSHLNDVAYLVKTQRDLKMIGEMVRGDEFAGKYGKLGQTIVNNWLDTVARQGKVNASQKWMGLDELRRRTSAGVIGFRLASQFVHLSNVPLAMWRTGGPGWYYAGLREAISPEGQQFLRDNFAETFTRGGGEPALQEASEKATTIGGKTIIPKSVNKAGFAVARGIDRYNSQATTLGIYLRLLKEKGKDFNNYDSIPVDKEAQAQALVLSRRAVASPLPKDVSQSLSRGALTGGNVSISRSLMQFQNIFQDQWSNIRVDLARAGIKEKNPKLAATAFASLLAMGLTEMWIREGAKQAISAVTGYRPKKERDVATRLLLEGSRRIPLGGQIASEVLYGETGIPVLDSIVNTAKSAKTMVTAKKPATQDKAAIRALSGAAQLGGVTGASQVGELLEKAY